MTNRSIGLLCLLTGCLILIGAVAYGQTSSGGAADSADSADTLVVGLVTDGGGRPLESVEIAVHRVRGGGALSTAMEPSEPVLRARSDTLGRFVLNGLDPEVRHRLLLTATGFVPQARIVGAGQGGPSLVVALVPGLTVVGRVLDLREQPIADAEVGLLPVADGHADPLLARTARTDENGRYSLPHVARGTHLLRAVASGRRELGVPGIEVEGAVADVPIDVGTILLAPDRPLVGRVVDGEGRGVAGADVLCRWRDGAIVRSAEAVVADENGRFAITGLPTAVDVILTASRDGYVDASVGGLASDTRAEARLELVRTASLDGQVVDPRGWPTPGAEVTLERPWARPLVTSTDAEGVFRFDDLEPGTVTVEAQRADAISDRRRVDLPRADDRAPLVLEIEPAAAILGSVVDPAGQPVVGAAVEVLRDGSGIVEATEPEPTGRSTSTDGEGRFAVSALGAGRYRVLARHDDFNTVAQLAEADPGGLEPIELAFEKRREAERFAVPGRVIGPGGGGIAGAEITLVRQDGGAPVIATSGPDGRFDMATEYSGKHSLDVRHAEYAWRSIEPFDLPLGDRAPLLVRLSRGGRIDGEVPVSIRISSPR